jgi:hypothetical protein
LQKQKAAARWLFAFAVNDIESHNKSIIPVAVYVAMAVAPFVHPLENPAENPSFASSFYFRMTPK